MKGLFTGTRKNRKVFPRAIQATQVTFQMPSSIFLALKAEAMFKDHFEADQYEGHRADGRKLLKWNAVPTIPACENARGRSRSIIAQKPDNGISAITGAQGAPPEVCVPQVCVVQPRTPGAAIGVLQNNPTTPSTAEVSGVRAPSPDVMQGDGYVVPLLTVEVEVQTGIRGAH